MQSNFPGCLCGEVLLVLYKWAGDLDLSYIIVICDVVMFYIPT